MESVEERYVRVGRLPGEVKARMAMEMTDVAVGVCAEGIKAQFPGITQKELIEKLRERFEWMKRHRRRAKMLFLLCFSDLVFSLPFARIFHFPKI